MLEHRSGIDVFDTVFPQIIHHTVDHDEVDAPILIFFLDTYAIAVDSVGMIDIPKQVENTERQQSAVAF